MHGIKAQEMGVGLDRAEIVDANHLDILAAGFGDGPQYVAADAAAPVDRDPDCHLSLLQLFLLSSRKALLPSTRVFAADARFGRAGADNMPVREVLFRAISTLTPKDSG